MERQAREDFKAYEGRISFIYLSGLSMEEMLERVSYLDEQTIIFYLVVFRDGDGKPFVPRNALRLISNTSHRPVYNLFNVEQGLGTVGGSVFSIEKFGSGIGNASLDLLEGKSIADVTAIEKSWETYLFNWQELQRWGIAESSLPPGSIVMYKQSTVWERYRWRIIGGIALIMLQTVLITVLLINRSTRLRTQRALNQSEKRFEGLVSNIPGAVYRCACNRERTMEYLSDEIETLAGYPASDFIHNAVRTYASIIHPDDQRMAEDTVQAAMINNMPYTIEYRVVHRDGGTCWVHERGQATRGEDGEIQYLDGAIFDISERKEAEIEIQQHREELARVLRIATTGELSASLAHELNQPLAAILSNAQAAQRFLFNDTPDIDELKDILADIVADDKRAGEVIRRFRLLLKKSEIQLERLNMNDVIQEVVTLVHSNAKSRNVSVAMDLDKSLPPVNGDRIQLQQVILNFIMNAFDVMEDLNTYSGTLIIKTRKGDSRMIIISVSDTGTGISQENLDKIFEPFYTTKSKGMGMGLSINRRIIEAHGGRLWAENNPDRGATFYFTIPER
jgi:PAS domain S-box-containing protein